MQITNSLKDSFSRPFKEPKLLGILFAEALVVLLVAIFFYALTLRFLGTMYALPLENIVELFAQNLLPPEAGKITLIMSILAGITFLFVTIFFEAGLFSRIAKMKESFFDAMKRLFVPFLLIVLFFQVVELASLVFYLPGMLSPKLLLLSNLLLLLSQLFLFVWDTTARVLAVKHRPLVSLKKSVQHIWKNKRDWGVLLLVVIMLLLVSLIVLGVLLWLTQTILVLLWLVLLLVVLYFLYLSLVVRILFYNRIKKLL